MFAGLPGIGVGTLYYVLTGLWMPVRECIVTAQGRSSWQRWRLVLTQFCFALLVVASIAIADRILSLLLGGAPLASLTPARVINEGFVARAPTSIMAAPIMASALLLALVLIGTEVARLLLVWSSRRAHVAEGSHDKRSRFAREGRSARDTSSTRDTRHAVRADVALHAAYSDEPAKS